MGTSKTKFNTNDLFVEGQHTPEERLNFIRSPLFPVVTTIYNTTDKTTRIGRVTMGDTTISALITTEEGFIVGKLRYYPHNKQYDFASVSDGLSEPSGNILISTSSVSYLRAKLSKNSSHVAAAWLRRNATDAKHCITNAIRGVIDSAVDKVYGSSVSQVPTVEFDADICTFMANVVMGKTTMLQMPSDMRQTFESKYRNYENNSQKFRDAIEKVKTFFDHGKWILIRNVNDGIILGAISHDGAVAGLNMYSNGVLPHGESYDYAPFSLKPRWYPNFEAIPEEYRRELDYAMMVLKVHRNAESVFPSEERQLWLDVGAASWSKILILPR